MRTCLDASVLKAKTTLGAAPSASAAVAAAVNDWFREEPVFWWFVGCCFRRRRCRRCRRCCRRCRRCCRAREGCSKSEQKATFHFLHCLTYKKGRKNPLFSSLLLLLSWKVKVKTSSSCCWCMTSFVRSCRCCCFRWTGEEEGISNNVVNPRIVGWSQQIRHSLMAFDQSCSATL